MDRLLGRDTGCRGEFVATPTSSSVRNPATRAPRRGAEPNRPRLHPYRLIGLGLRDDGTTHTMLVALVYDDPRERPRRRPALAGARGQLPAPGEWSTARRARSSASRILSSPATARRLFCPLRSVTLPIWGLWQRMLAQRDYGFLAE
jgi:hypothetical protein